MLEPIAATALTALISSVVGALVGAVVAKVRQGQAWQAHEGGAGRVRIG